MAIMGGERFIARMSEFRAKAIIDRLEQREFTVKPHGQILPVKIDKDYPNYVGYPMPVGLISRYPNSKLWHLDLLNIDVPFPEDYHSKLKEKCYAPRP